MKKLCTLLTVCILVFSSTLNIFSQPGQRICPIINSVNVSSRTYFPVTDKDTLKALIIFVRYQDDNFWCCDSWPPEMWTVPEWGKNMLSQMGSSTIVNPSLSGYFDAMSSSRGMHGWQLRGDVFPSLYVTAYPAYHYQGAGGVGAVAEEVLKTLDSKINFADYDRYDPCDFDKDGNYNEPDGYADMIILWFRWICSGIDGSTYSGVCALGGLSMQFPDGIDTTDDVISVHGVPKNVKLSPYAPGGSNTIASGMVGEGTSPKEIDIFAHEMGHYLMGLWHTQRLCIWDMMTGNGVGIMNSVQREMVGWIPSVGHPNEFGIYNIHLQDFETMGEAYVFDGKTERYIIENRSEAGFYSKKSNWKMPGNGLLIAKENFNAPINSDPISLACADHEWRWANFGLADCGMVPCLRMHDMQFLYPFKKLEPSVEGFSGMDIHDVCTFDGINVECHNYDSSWGVGGNLWNVGYNQVFSPWSNPRTVPASNNKGISIELVNKYTDGSVDLIVRYGVDNVEVGAHPSKPLGLYASKYYFDPDMPLKFHPQVMWMKNLEPDVNVTGSTAKYYIYRGLTPAPKLDPEYYLIASVPTESNSYTDTNITLFDPGNYYGCAFQERNYCYRITVMDIENLESVRSDRAVVTGYIDPCSPGGGNKWITGQNNDQSYEFKIFNYPNPFNPSTDIKYYVPHDSYVTIKIYNALGQDVSALVTNEFRKAGNYIVRFDGTNYASGIYFYQLISGSTIITKKMLLIK